jgi:hypothetical protein
MSTPTLDQVLRDAQQLSITDQQLLAELLKLPKTIKQLAEEQGIGPFDFESARAQASNIWPEEETVDDFIAFLRDSRRDSSQEREFD